MQASPAPISARPASASSIDGLTANSSSPTPHGHQAERERPPRPDPVGQQPRRDLHPRYMPSCTVESTAIVLVVTPNRSPRRSTPRQGSSDGRSPPDRRPPPTPTSAKPQSCTHIVSNLHTRCIQGSDPGMRDVCKRYAGDSPGMQVACIRVCMDDDDWPPDPLNERPRVSASRRAYRARQATDPRRHAGRDGAVSRGRDRGGARGQPDAGADGLRAARVRGVAEALSEARRHRHPGLAPRETEDVMETRWMIERYAIEHRVRPRSARNSAQLAEAGDGAGVHRGRPGVPPRAGRRAPATRSCSRSTTRCATASGGCAASAPAPTNARRRSWPSTASWPPRWPRARTRRRSCGAACDGALAAHARGADRPPGRRRHAPRRYAPPSLRWSQEAVSLTMNCSATRFAACSG